MKEAERVYLLQWLEKAEHDLIAAQLIIEHNPLILDVACFHFQQAAEKYLKTFLIFKKTEFPKTHSLDLLLKICSEQESLFERIDIKNLEDFAVRGRYPHDYLSPELEEATEFNGIVVGIKELVLILINV